MGILRIGQVEYLNCLPIYHALEEGIIPFGGKLVKGVPARLNEMFLSGNLEVTPISSIEYARYQEKCIILPNLSIAADGEVKSILFFSRRPVKELNGKNIHVTRASATSVALLQILLDHYYQIKAQITPLTSDLFTVLNKGEGALLIGDQAMQAHQRVLEQNLPVYVIDLGKVWKIFTGKKMIYALWVIRNEFALAHSEETTKILNLLLHSKKIGLSNLCHILPKAHLRTNLPVSVIKDYFKIICYDFNKEERSSLLTFYNWAYQSGLIKDKVKLRVWGEK